MSVHPLHRVLLAAATAISLPACTSEDMELARPWYEPVDSTEVRTLVDSPELCLDCMRLEEVVSFGDTLDGPGFVEFTDAVVQDDQGRFWVGQPGWIKVFGSDGEFLRQVGREGEGPNEFRYPRPIHSDGEGRVVVFDIDNQRRSVIGPEFEVSEATRFEGLPLEIVSLGSGRYAFGSVGHPPVGQEGPIAVSDGGPTLYSFGLSETRIPINRMYVPTGTRLAVGPSGRVYASSWWDYRIRIWTPEGRLVSALDGPIFNGDLDLTSVELTFENPFPTQITLVEPDGPRHLLAHRVRFKSGWQEVFEEIDGRLRAREGRSASEATETVIERIDLDGGEVVARVVSAVPIYLRAAPKTYVSMAEDRFGFPRLTVWKLVIDPT